MSVTQIETSGQVVDPPSLNWSVYDLHGARAMRFAVDGPAEVWLTGTDKEAGGRKRYIVSVGLYPSLATALRAGDLIAEALALMDAPLPTACNHRSARRQRFKRSDPSVLMCDDCNAVLSVDQPPEGR